MDTQRLLKKNEKKRNERVKNKNREQRAICNKTRKIQQQLAQKANTIIVFIIFSTKSK
jgi:hypothetical protein